MLVVRGILALGMIAIGAIIIVRMFPYPIAGSFTGLVLGAAMIALGAYRLLQLKRVVQSR